MGFFKYSVNGSLPNRIWNKHLKFNQERCVISSVDSVAKEPFDKVKVHFGIMEQMLLRSALFFGCSKLDIRFWVTPKPVNSVLTSFYWNSRIFSMNLKNINNFEKLKYVRQ